MFDIYSLKRVAGARLRGLNSSYILCLNDHDKYSTYLILQTSESLEFCRHKHRQNNILFGNLSQISYQDHLCGNPVWSKRPLIDDAKR